MPKNEEIKRFDLLNILIVSRNIDFIDYLKGFYTKTVYFDFDKYTLNSNGKESVNDTANVLKTIPNLSVRIEGNADSRGSDEYNYALGLKRATEVKNALVNAGVTNELQTVSYGEAKPNCTETNEDCFSKNRRVDFKQVD